MRKGRSCLTRRGSDSSEMGERYGVDREDRLGRAHLGKPRPVESVQ